jgi:hypothetical protein
MAITLYDTLGRKKGMQFPPWMEAVAKKILEYNKTKDPKVFISRAKRQLEAGSPTIKLEGFLDQNQAKAFARASKEEIARLAEKTGVSPTIIKNAQIKYNALSASDRRSPVATEGQLKYFDRKTEIQRNILKQIDNKVFSSKEIAKNLGISHKKILKESEKLFKNIYEQKMFLNSGKAATSTYLPDTTAGLNTILDKLWKVKGFGLPEAQTWFKLVRDAREAGRLTADQFKKATSDVKNFYDLKNLIQKKYPSVILNLDHPLSRGTLTMLNAKGEKFLTGIPTTERFNKGIKEKLDVRYKNLIGDVRKGVTGAGEKKAALENLARELKIDIGEVSKTGKKITSLGEQSVVLGKRGVGRGIIESLEKQNVLAKNIKNVNPELLEAAGMEKYFKKTTLPEISARTIEGVRKTILDFAKSNKGGVCGIFRAEGGRIGFAAGSSCVAEMETALRTDPIKTTEQISRLPGNKTINSLKTAAGGFLKMLGRGGVRAAPYAALAAAGAAIEPLVKQFRIDDPTTYLTDESQMKGMLLATIEGETPKVDQELLNWQYPGMAAATAAGAIPGAGAVYKGRRGLPPTKDFVGPMQKGVGPARAALGIKGVLGKALGATFSPLAVAATLPISVAAQRKGGTEWGDIATDPLNWMAPAFASTGAEMATRGMAPTGILAKALRMGMSPRTLSLVARRFGMPGLAISAGMWGYDKWKNRSINDPED